MGLGPYQMVALIEAQITQLASAIAAAFAGGSAVIGKVGIDQTTPGTSNAVYLTASENHIGQVGGQILYASHEFTRPSDATDYAIGDAVANSTSVPTVLTFANIARVAAGSGYITGASVIHEKASVTPALRLHLFNAAPTPVNDNAALSLTYAIVSAASYLGYIDFAAMVTDGGTDYSRAQDMTIRIPFSGQAARDLYGLLETRSVFTPGNAKKIIVKLRSDVN